jgi:HEAT repeat protein
MCKPLMLARKRPALVVSWFVTLLVFVVTVGSDAQRARFDEAVGRLKSPDARERLGALQSLREAAFPEAIPAIAPLVSDIDDRVQLSAIAAEVRLFLAEGGEKTTIVDAFGGVPFTVYPRPVPRDLTVALLRAIGDETKQVRLDAAYALGAIGRPPLAQPDAAPLLNALRHKDAATRAAAARACGRLQVRESGDALVETMNDADGDVRLAAIWALGELRFDRAVQALTDFASHYGASPAGLASMASLARIAHPSSAPLFRAALGDRNAEVRRLGAEGIGRLRDRAALPRLEQGAAAERDPRAQAALLFAMNMLGARQAESLAMLLADKRAFALTREYLRELGAPAVPALVPQLEHSDADIRRGVVDVLGVIGGADMANTIWTLQQDPDNLVREATTRALERLKVRAGLAA